MFTGIIQTTGTIAEITEDRITIESSVIAKQLKKGGSIAVDGVCFTAVEITNASFTLDVMPETVSKTTLGLRQKGDFVNLELPMSADGRFEGHIVSGHVEGVAEIIDITFDKNAHILTFKISFHLDKYIVKKGSITINGISLTIIDVQNNQFTVGIIPHTWEITNLHQLSVGDKVNIETDLLAKYVEKLLKKI